MARGRGTRCQAGAHRLEINVRHRRRQGKRRTMVQAGNLGKHPSRHQTSLEIGCKTDVRRVRHHVATTRCRSVFALFASGYEELTKTTSLDVCFTLESRRVRRKSKCPL